MIGRGCEVFEQGRLVAEGMGHNEDCSGLVGQRTQILQAIDITYGAMQAEDEHVAVVGTDFRPTDDEEAVPLAQPRDRTLIPDVIVFGDANTIETDRLCPPHELVRVHIGASRAVAGMGVKIDLHDAAVSCVRHFTLPERSLSVPPLGRP